MALLLLLSPVFEWVHTKKRKPLLVMALDNSASVKHLSDSVNLNGFAKQWKQFEKDLENQFDIKSYLFAENITQTNSNTEISFNGRHSNYSKTLANIEAQLRQQNISAFILAGDGVYNQGSNPIYQSEKLGAPVYSVALGDTTRYPDQELMAVKYPKEIAIKSNLPLEVSGYFHQYRGQTTTIRVKKGKQLIHQERVKITTNDQYYHKIFFLPNDSAGLQRINISIENQSNENNTINNQRNIVYRVIKDQKKIAIIANGPHPDLGKFKSFLAQNPNYETQIIWNKTNTVLPKQTDLFVVYQLPSKGKNNHLINQIQKSKTPVVYWLGRNSDLNAFNQLKTGITFSTTNLWEEINATVNSDFKLFSIPSDWNNLSNQMPPLVAPMATLQVHPKISTILKQKIKDIEIDQPLIASGLINGRKKAFIIGEGLWRWSIRDNQLSGNNKHTSKLFNQLISYLLTDNRKQKFILNYNSSGYTSSPFLVTAQVLNANLHPLDDALVSIKLLHEKGQIYDFQATFKQGQYHSNMGNLPEGKYQLKASATFGDSKYNHIGEFLILKQNPEQNATIANHNLMLKIASISGAKKYDPHQLGQLKQELETKFKQQRNHKITENYWLPELKLFALILLLLICLEWFLRKYWGVY